MPPARLGLVYSHTGLRKFIDAIGAPRTRELFFTARNVGAGEALAWGLVGEVLPAADVAARGVELAAEIAANAPLSLAGNKRVIRSLLAARGTLDAAVEQELVALRDACFRSEDFFEGVRAFAEKRAPRWRGR
jgi:enoyl-CoA hydratase/carnithine racemase